jgi:sterol desaturase/sphingolipid hydroxylase (fatty acid hydroxylase superfamily)
MGGWALQWITSPFLRKLIVITGIYIVMTSVIYCFERRMGAAAVEKYRTRAHFHQFVWYLFRNSGLHELILLVWYYALISRYFGFLNLHLMDEAPIAVRFGVIFLAVDLVQYWGHRLRHSVPMLWTFHAVHHSAETLTPGGMDQVHPVDDYVAGFYLTITLMIFGTYPQEWFGVVLVRKFTEFLQHSGINWRFGPLYYVFVSPAFHRVHHARDVFYRDRNYGTHLSVWDYVFGTAADPVAIPDRYGVENLVMPTLAQQMFAPFRTLYKETFRKVERSS